MEWKHHQHQKNRRQLQQQHHQQQLVTSVYSQFHQFSHQRSSLREPAFLYGTPVVRDEAVEVDPFSNRIMPRSMFKFTEQSPHTPSRRLRPKSPGYAVEPAAIEIMLDQPLTDMAVAPRSEYPDSVINPPPSVERKVTNKDQDLPEAKTWATTSTADTSSPSKSSASATLPDSYDSSNNRNRRKSFRDRFMKRKSSETAQTSPIRTNQPKFSDAKATKSDSTLPGATIGFGRTSRIEPSPLITPTRGHVQAAPSKRGRSLSVRVTPRNSITCGSTTSPPPVSLASSDRSKSRRRGSSLSRARLIVKRSLCTTKAVDEEHEISRMRQQGSAAQGTLSFHLRPPATSIGKNGLLSSPVASPLALQLSPGAVEVAASPQPVETPGPSADPQAYAPTYVTPGELSSPAKSSGAAEAGAGAEKETRSSSRIRGAETSMRDRKPTSIEMVRQGSHVSELSLPVLYHPRLRSDRKNMHESHQGTSLGNGSAKAIREILTQVEEEISRGASRSDILAQLRALSETLEREVVHDSNGDHREFAYKAGDANGAVRAPDEADRGDNTIDYEKKLLELRERSLGLDQKSRCSSRDFDETYESGDESSGMSADGGEGDDLSEFTKWLEEIENEEGGIAQDSINFLLGLFNFQSLMLVKQEESESEANSQSSLDSDARHHRASSFRPVSTTGSNFWSSLQPQSNDNRSSSGWWADPGNDSGQSPVDDGKDETLSLSSIESNQYSKQSQGRRSSNNAKYGSSVRSSKARASGNMAMYPHPRDSKGKAGGSDVDYDLMWDSSRRRRSRSFRGAFRSRSSASRKTR